MSIGTPRLKERGEEKNDNNLVFELRHIQEKNVASPGFLQPLWLEGDSLDEAFPCQIAQIVQGTYIDLTNHDSPLSPHDFNLAKLIDRIYAQPASTGVTRAKHLLQVRTHNLRLEAEFLDTASAHVVDPQIAHRLFAADVKSIHSQAPKVFVSSTADGDAGAEGFAQLCEVLELSGAIVSTDVKQENFDFGFVFGTLVEGQKFALPEAEVKILEELGDKDALIPVLLAGNFGSAFPAVGHKDLFKTLIHNLRASQSAFGALDEVQKIICRVFQFEDSDAYKQACSLHKATLNTSLIVVQKVQPLADVSKLNVS